MFSIDDDVLRFLNGHLGNKDEDAYVRCSNFAYRDMCRTITYAPNWNENKTKSQKTQIIKAKETLRGAVTNILKTQIADWKKNKSITQRQFEEEHKNLCEKIIEIFNGTTAQGEKNNSLYFGQAQKWVNMTLKNLYVYSKSNHTSFCIDHLLGFLHVPIDNVILDLACGNKQSYMDPPNIQYNVAKPVTAWSKWDYKTYCDYQDKLKRKIGEITPKVTPIIWELTRWSTII